MSNYIHPNLNPSDLDKYLSLVNKLRTLAIDTNVDTLFVTKEEYNILEDSANETMKGRGHTVYGKEVEIKYE